MVEDNMGSIYWTREDVPASRCRLGPLWLVSKPQSSSLPLESAPPSLLPSLLAGEVMMLWCGLL